MCRVQSFQGLPRFSEVDKSPLAGRVVGNKYDDNGVDKLDRLVELKKCGLPQLQLIFLDNDVSYILHRNVNRFNF